MQEYKNINNAFRLTETLTKVEQQDSLNYWIHPNKNYACTEVQEALLKENIIYDGHGVFPILIVNRSDEFGDFYSFVIGEEDDGHIWFKRDKFGKFNNIFNTRWTYHLIEMLMKGMQRIQDGKVIK